MTTHNHESRGLSFAEASAAFEKEFRRIKKEQGSEGNLAVRDPVVYRTRFGEFHLGPLQVVSLDAHSVLIRGYLNGHEVHSELRVERRELVRFADVRGILDKILNTMMPCPACSEQDVAKIAGRRDN